MKEEGLYSKLPLKNQNSFFLSARKDEFSRPDLQSELKDLLFPPEVLNFHPKRKEEFLLGRMLLKKAFKEFFQLNVRDFPIEKSRRAVAPEGFSLSITHDHDEVMVVISKLNSSVGIDLETIGRIKPAMEKQILSASDQLLELMDQSKLSRDEVLALIFSAKESFYKVLYPKVQKYFGFEKAYLVSVEFHENGGKFEIALCEDLIGESGSFQKGFSLNGLFAFGDQKLLTYLEIP